MVEIVSFWIEIENFPGHSHAMIEPEKERVREQILSNLHNVRAVDAALTLKTRRSLRILSEKKENYHETSS